MAISDGIDRNMEAAEMDSDSRHACLPSGGSRKRRLDEGLKHLVLVRGVMNRRSKYAADGIRQLGISKYAVIFILIMQR